MNVVWKQPDGKGGYYVVYHETSAEMVKYSDTTVANILDNSPFTSVSNFMQGMLSAADAKAARKILSAEKAVVYDECGSRWTLSGEPSISDGKLVLNGSSFVKRGTLVTLGGSEPFTLEISAQNTTSYTDAETRAFVNCFASNNDIILLHPKQNQPRLFWKDNGTNIINLTNVDADCYTTAKHLALSYDGTTMRYFIDGQLIQTLDQVFTAKNYRIFFGYSNSSGAYAACKLDEFRLSDVCRYTSNFTPATRHELDANTLSLLHFD